jgi:hypothetical protein
MIGCYLTASSDDENERKKKNPVFFFFASTLRASRSMLEGGLFYS